MKGKFSKCGLTHNSILWLLFFFHAFQFMVQTARIAYLPAKKIQEIIKHNTLNPHFCRGVVRYTCHITFWRGSCTLYFWIRNFGVITFLNHNRVLLQLQIILCLWVSDSRRFEGLVGVLDPWRWKQYDPSKRRESPHLTTQCHVSEDFESLSIAVGC
jgi:hypothetical protein